jgi:ABC-type multidrug transport system fused ATPase/permease subunit
MSLAIDLYLHFTPRRRWQLKLVLLLLLACTAAEMLTLGSLVPLLVHWLNPHGMAGERATGAYFGLGVTTLQNASHMAWVFVGAVLATALLRLAMLRSMLHFSYACMADLASKVYRNTLRRPYAWHVSHHSSEILGAMENCSLLSYTVLTPALQAAVAVVLVFGLLSMMLLVAPWEAFMALLILGLLYALSVLIFRRRLIRNSQVIAKHVNQRVQTVQEGLAAIRDILIDGSQDEYVRRFEHTHSALREAQLAYGVMESAPKIGIEAVSMLLLVLIAHTLSDADPGLKSTLPALGALAWTVQKILPQIQSIYRSVVSLMGHRQNLHDLLVLLQVGAARPSPDQAATVGLYPADPADPSNQGQQPNPPLIRLHHVSYRHRTSGPEVLRDVSLSIQRGERIGIVGATGSGKSTLMDLLLCLVDPTSGQLEIMGKPVDEAVRRLWHLRVAHVPQTIHLADASIARNIAWGQEPGTIDMQRVRQAAQRAQIEDFIHQLPAQFDCPVGEQGVRLSGGQRQRIGLARAFYKRANVLILDEATSALDEETEKDVIESIRALASDITLVVISHRPSALAFCQRLIRIQNHGITIESRNSS